MRPFAAPGVRHSRNRAYSLVEVMVGVALIAILLPGAITAIQWSRVQSRNISLGILAENTAQALMEMVKRGGYENITYGGAFPDLMETEEEGEVVYAHPLLDFPRSAGRTLTTTLPAGAVGNASGPEDFVMGNDGIPSAILSDVNYLQMSDDQIAALNGYRSMSDVPEGANMLNPQLSWGVYVEEELSIADPLKRHKLVIVAVKWQNALSGKVRYTTSRALVWARDDTRI
jgi:prepilin-type N-terminal cleavage/methylation domain-containing protein